ncbi:hypothetical protein BDAP_002580 [Binucleata daphniae]
MENNLLNIADLREKKDNLLVNKKNKENEIKEHIKNNLIVFRNVINNFCEENCVFDVKLGIIDLACYRIKELHDACEKELLENITKFVNTRNADIRNEIEILLKVMYSLNTLQKKISKKKKQLSKNVNKTDKTVRNEFKNNTNKSKKIMKDNVKSEKYNDCAKQKDSNKQKDSYTIKNYDKIKAFTIKINIKDCVCKIFDNETVLVEKVVSGAEWKSDKQIIEFFTNDFSFDFSIMNLNYKTQKIKLKALMNVLESQDFDFKSLCSYKKETEQNNTLISDNAMISKRNKMYIKNEIKNFVNNVLDKKNDKKYAGLLVSYFFMLCPGLIHLFDYTEFEKQPEFYYFAWIREVKHTDSQN